ncbi:hypothetical protein SY83_12980 [Paenibacillus swuensis]|uniref:Type II secretion system protein GspF domain-containing protein n=1 Tax=Paenibacillus swuensis TaxID=1178515 RepID=A0A172TJ49_9BACL|nr:hypothetical protein [Paenibacillus swuensis]ANE47030.1 hypothetical protein SY83_12980 [Paenibacillus swuensis]
MVISWLITVSFAIGILLVLHPVVYGISRLLVKRNTYSFFRRQRKEPERHQLLDLERLPGFARLETYMSVAGVQSSPFLITCLSIIIFIVLFSVTYRTLASFISSLVIGGLFSGLPFIYIWHRYQRMQQRMARVMIPTVQTFIGYFTEAENLAGAIYKAGGAMPAEMAGEWARLTMELETGEAAEPSVIKFAERVGNHWAQDFADILIIHLETGTDIVPSLFKLINEMQNAMYNEEKRNTLLAVYRYGTLLMIAMAVFIVGFNIWIQPSNRVYYFTDPGGKKYVTVTVVVLFASFIGALQLGKKKI